MKKTLTIGAPTANRGWIIREWLNYLHPAVMELGDSYRPGIVLVADQKDESVPVVANFCQAMHYDFDLVAVEESREGDKRQWNEQRFHRMVYLRNLLLERVRDMEPDLFLSLDTDILLHRDAIKCMVDTMETFDADAVGGKTYMTMGGRGAPSCARFKRARQGLMRPDSDGVLKMDVIMAIKLMRESAYSVDYRYHSHGEDIGWSAECRKLGLNIYWDGRVASKHVMEPSRLYEIDRRVGF